MANRTLWQLYSLLYNEEFSHSDFSKRRKMQKGIYLLQEMGVPVGNYRFCIYKYGPYSQSLFDDMKETSISSNKFLLSTDTSDTITDLSTALIVPDSVNYPTSVWVECLGTLHYLKEKVLSFSCLDEEILQELKYRSKHLNDDDGNRMALAIINSLFYKIEFFKTTVNCKQ